MTIKDITEQELAKKQLKEIQHRNAAIISAIPDMMFIIDESGLIVDIISSREDKGIFGIEVDVLNKYIADLLPDKAGDQFDKPLKQAFSSGRLVVFEYEITIKNQQYWFDIRMIKSSEREVLSIVRDISKRKLQEIELKQQKRFIETLLDSIPNPLFYMDIKGVYLGVNKALKEFYGIEKEDIVGKNIFGLSYEDDAENLNDSELAIFEGRESHQLLEREIKLKDGSLKNVIITKSPFPDSDGNIGGLIGLIIDITERKLMEEDLRTAKERAEESDRLKTSFLNNLSHEIRTPMNAIVGFAELLEMDYPREQQKSFIATINTNAEQLLHMIDEVLTISRLDTEKNSVEMKSFAPAILLQDLFNTFEPEANKQNLKLKVDTRNLPDDYSIVGDKNKIHQVLAGFISNALKYTLVGEISFGAEIIENKQIRFFVADTGLGITELEQEKVFERFYRTDEAHHLAIRGNGLGLSIAMGLVELMGGVVSLESEHGKGSEFSFSLKV